MASISACEKIRFGRLIGDGLRKSELLHLRWVDFDAEASAVRVEEHHEARPA